MSYIGSIPSTSVVVSITYVYFYYNNFDREGPRGADIYILLNVATECSRNYAKNIHRSFTVHMLR
jgi:hypothetical protein